MGIIMGVEPEQTQPKPLFNFGNFGGCERCWGTGLFINDAGNIAKCPGILMKDVHPELAPGAEIFALRFPVYPLGKDQPRVSKMAFDLARILTHFGSAEPCKRDFLLNHFFGALGEKFQTKLRKFNDLVAELLDAFVPIGARKDEPSGYYFITTAGECEAWLKHSTAAALKKLSRNYRCAKANFPHLTGQPELDFLDYHFSPGADASQYHFFAEYSGEDSLFIGRVVEFPSLAAHGATHEAALNEIKIVVDLVLKDLSDENRQMGIAEQVMREEMPVLKSLFIHDTEGPEAAKAFINECSYPRACRWCQKTWPKGGVQDGSSLMRRLPGEPAEFFCNKNCLTNWDEQVKRVEQLQETTVA